MKPAFLIRTEINIDRCSGANRFSRRRIKLIFNRALIVVTKISQLLFFGHALLGQPAFGTSIVALTIEDRSIVISADSIVIGRSKTTGSQERVSYCKIRCVEHACFAASGRYANETIGYDLFATALLELQQQDGPQAASGRLKTYITRILPRLLEVSKLETPAEYEIWLTGRPVLGFLFGGFDTNRTPIIVRWQVRLTSTGAVIPEPEVITRGRVGRVGALAQGWSENIAAFWNQNPQWTESAITHPVETAGQLVRIEIGASERSGRRDVGEPVSIVSLTPIDGFRVEVAGACKQQ